MMDHSESSSLSSAPASGDEKLAPIFLKAKGKPLSKHKPSIPVLTPPKRKRTPSPEVEETLADNPNIAFIVMFRNRFADAFPPKLAHFGPQDIERGVVDVLPSPQTEDLLCALLGMLLNRKKPVERGHHGRALEEALSSQRSQWPRSWNDVNPLSGNKSFATMTPVQRLDLLRHLIIWSLTTSEQVSAKIKDMYKQARHDDDLNQPLAVQAWGRDMDKRSYYLIEGLDDTSFRLYREANRMLKSPTWRSVAGTIEEIKAMAEKLDKDSSVSARQMAKSIMRTIPRFEATEEKRKRREYRQIRRSQFVRPEPGFYLYEGRTRGKRMRYTYDDDDDDDPEDTPEPTGRRSGRFSDRSTPAEPPGPVVTASGRQVKARGGGLYGESLLGNQANGHGGSGDVDLDADRSNGTHRRSVVAAVELDGRARIHNDDDEGSQASQDETVSSAGWNSAANDDDHDDHTVEDDDDDLGNDDAEDGGYTINGVTPSSLLVKLKMPSANHLDHGSNAEKHLTAQDVVHPKTHHEALKPESPSKDIADRVDIVKPLQDATGPDSIMTTLESDMHADSAAGDSKAPGSAGEDMSDARMSHGGMTEPAHTLAIVPPVSIS